MAFGAFVQCVDSNVRDAAWTHDAIVAGLERRIAELEAELSTLHYRQDLTKDNLEWLLGYYG